jgi:protein-disulfide isomerase
VTKPSTADRPARAKRAGAAKAAKPRSAVRRWAFPAMLGAAVLALAAIAVLGSRPVAPSAAADGSRAGSAPVVGASPLTLGQAAAKVQLDEYGDFQCTSCEAFFRGVEPQLKAAYIDTGKVRLVWHDFPWIGQESLDAADAARCAADQGRFWPYHDLLYRKQGAENSGAFSVANLKSFGAQLGLDTAAFNACVDANTHLAAVKADLATAASSGFPGTPTFTLGGQRIIGAQPYAVFAQALDAALGR